MPIPIFIIAAVLGAIGGSAFAYGDHCAVDRAYTRRRVAYAQLRALDHDLDGFLDLAAGLERWASQCEAAGNFNTAAEIRADIQAAINDWLAETGPG